MIYKGPNLITRVRKGLNTVFRFIFKGSNMIFRFGDLLEQFPQRRTVSAVPGEDTHEIRYEYNNQRPSLLESDIQIPDWVEIISLTLAQGTGIKISTLVYRTQHNTTDQIRTGEIISTFREPMATLIHDLTQNPVSQILGGVFVMDGETLTALPAPARANLEVGSGGLFDLIVFSDGLSPLEFTLTPDTNITLEGGAAVESQTFTIPNGATQLRVNLQITVGGAGGPFSLDINPVDAFSVQTDITPQNSVLRTSTLSANLASSEANPIPGDNVTITLSGVNLLTTEDAMFEIYSDEARTNQIGATQTLTASQITGGTIDRTFTVAFPAGASGISADRTVFGRIIQGTTTFDGTTMTPLTVAINTRSVALTGASSTQTSLWNNASIADLTTVASAPGSAPTGWRISQIQNVISAAANGLTTTNVQGTAATTSGSSVAFTTSFTVPIHSRDTAGTWTNIYRFNYTNTAFDATTSIDLASSSGNKSIRPGITGANGSNSRIFAGESDSVFSSFDFGATADIVVMMDSGSTTAATADAGNTLASEGIFPQVDESTTDPWIDDVDQVPTNAQFTANPGNFIGVFTDDQLNDIQTEAGSDIFDDANPATTNLIVGFESQRPYAGMYSIQLMTLDSGEGSGANIGRNTSGMVRMDQICINESTVA